MSWTCSFAGLLSTSAQAGISLGLSGLLHCAVHRLRPRRRNGSHRRKRSRGQGPARRPTAFGTRRHVRRHRSPDPCGDRIMVRPGARAAGVRARTLSRRRNAVLSASFPGTAQLHDRLCLQRGIAGARRRAVHAACPDCRVLCQHGPQSAADIRHSRLLGRDRLRRPRGIHRHQSNRRSVLSAVEAAEACNAVSGTVPTFLAPPSPSFGRSSCRRSRPHSRS